METDAQTLHIALRKRYPNAEVFVLDDKYELPTKEVYQRYLKRFRKWLRALKLANWVRNIRDCDKFAHWFKGYVGVSHATGDDDNALPVGFICYLIGGDKDKGHAINNAVYAHGKGLEIGEIEPQDASGTFSLTKKERESVWLVVV